MGARLPKMNITFSPSVASCSLLPLRKPSPTPTRSNSDPTPHAMPNMVRKERSLCAHRVRMVCPKMSKTKRISSLSSYSYVETASEVPGKPIQQRKKDTRFHEGPAFPSRNFVSLAFTSDVSPDDDFTGLDGWTHQKAPSVPNFLLLPIHQFDSGKCDMLYNLYFQSAE